MLRKVQGLETVDTLITIGDVLRTSWVDTSLSQHTVYEYRVSAVNASGYEATSDGQADGPMRLPAVEIVSAEFDSRAATATLTWEPYQGPEFRAYQVRRRTEKLAATVVAELPDSTAASWVDSGLAGATDYHYGVVVLTERGEEVVGPEVVGDIHRLVETWPLEVELVGRTSPGNVRLYVESGGRIAALVVDPLSAKICWYNPGNGLIEDRDLEFIPFGGQYDHFAHPITPSNMAMALHPLGMRCVSMGSGATGTVGIVPLGADESPILREWTPFAGEIPWELDEAESTVLGEIRLGTAPAKTAHFDQVAVTAAGETVFADDFDAFPESGGMREDLVETAYGWRFEGWHGFSDGWVTLFGWIDGNHGPCHMSRADTAWRDLGRAADLPGQGVRYIERGGDTFSRFRLTLDGREMPDGRETPPRLELAWMFLPPEGVEHPTRGDTLATPFRVLAGMRYQLALEVVEGEVEVTVRGPTAWIDTLYEEPQSGSLVAIGEGLALTFDEHAFSVAADGEITRLAPLESWVSETRAWQIPGELLPRIGVCLPGQNQIHTGTVLRASAWTQGLRTSLGPFIGQKLGALSHPVSFDVSSDGRMYVLDAGNARIVSFDAGGRYITEWGDVGSGDGQFNFGYGGRTERGLDFVGSLCVDDKGYIYVADVFNQRIQVFSPD